ncbi:MAG: hypothetical protein CL840_00275 [Crocinitomicaceae bacterium]|nr:hypothetical protein [Crocinitomicaceae bacterium]|tara:strand:+ start:19212 stop:21185 length:1974 start_codon:yes stop_codon:yes gene_type:complete
MSIVAKRLVPTSILIGFSALVLAYSSLFLDPTQPLKFFLLAVLCFLSNGFAIIQWRQILSSGLSLLFFGFQVLYILTSLLSVMGLTDVTTGIYETLKIILLFNFQLLGYILLKRNKKINLRDLGYTFAIIQAITLAGLGIALANIDTITFKSVFKLSGGLFINGNLSSQVLFLTTPLTIYSWLNTGNNRVRKILAALTLINLIVIFLLGSWTIFFALAVLFISFLLYRFFVSQHYSKKLKYTVSSIALLFVCILSFFLYPQISQKQSFSNRIALWKRTAGMIRESPILGSGIGTWHINSQYQVVDRETAIRQSNNLELDLSGNLIYLRPHNDFLWIWAEVGIVGLLFYIIIFMLIIYGGIRLLSSRNPSSKSLVFLCTSTILSYLVIAFLSFPKERIGLSLLLSTYVIILLVIFDENDSTNTTKTPLNRIFILCLLLIAGFSTFVGAKRLRAEYYMRNTLEAKEKKHWQQGLSNLQKGKTEFYRIASDGMPVSWYGGIFHMELGRLKKAHDYFLKAYHYHPTQIHVLNNLATTYGQLGQLDSAILYYQKAICINPVFDDPRINLSAVYFNLGDLDMAWNEISLVSTNTSHDQYNHVVMAILSEKWKSLIMKEAKERDLEVLSKRKFDSIYLLKKTIKRYQETKQDFVTLFFEDIESW